MEFTEIRDCVYKAKDAKVSVYAQKKLFDSMKGDRTLKQITNVSGGTEVTIFLKIICLLT